MELKLETPRLQLFPWTEEHRSDLKDFLQDAEVMYAYEHAFSDEEVENWLNWNIDNYQNYGYGLWGIKDTELNVIVGECGLTRQQVDGIDYLEIGYHLKKKYWHKGYAIEAAELCKKYAFEQTDTPAVVSIIRDTNLSSMKVAIRNGMLPEKRFVKHYQGIDMPHYLFAINRKDYERMK
ncbi:GNAT family N-acetyltransferase [Enterococcus sp. BWR-S5]|uniref:GNAT family N-acetyltransferase n=1 Tax=Enterococcus sp. BWR-S5 TaxID=2787714 RepID=UPI0019240BCF|nr:GNAT family N-acetyltransferase [Enterococcus sp. BWR-S5]MBL1227409.1 GNAT family N-acetyltransferase [Enterococcus sp. BWR-S5]